MYTPIYPVSAHVRNATLSAVVALTVPTQARRLILTVETQNVRITWTGVDPSATLGILFPAGDTYDIPVAPGQVLEIIEVTASAVINYVFSG